MTNRGDPCHDVQNAGQPRIAACRCSFPLAMRRVGSHALPLRGGQCRRPSGSSRQSGCLLSMLGATCAQDRKRVQEGGCTTSRPSAALCRTHCPSTSTCIPSCTCIRHPWAQAPMGMSAGLLHESPPMYPRLHDCPHTNLRSCTSARTHGHNLRQIIPSRCH